MFAFAGVFFLLEYSSAEERLLVVSIKSKTHLIQHDKHSTKGKYYAIYFTCRVKRSGVSSTELKIDSILVLHQQTALQERVMPSLNGYALRYSL